MSHLNANPKINIRREHNRKILKYNNVYTITYVKMTKIGRKAAEITKKESES